MIDVRKGSVLCNMCIHNPVCRYRDILIEKSGDSGDVTESNGVIYTEVKCREFRSDSTRDGSHIELNTDRRIELKNGDAAMNAIFGSSSLVSTIPETQSESSTFKSTIHGKTSSSYQPKGGE